MKFYIAVYNYIYSDIEINDVLIISVIAIKSKPYKNAAKNF